MSVRTAVATRDAAVEEVKERPTPAQILKDTIDKRAQEIRAVLPASMDAGRFSRLVLQACKAAPDLLRCFETAQGGASLLLAVNQCAMIGLEPNTPLQEAWLLPRRRSVMDPATDEWLKIWECQLQIGYRGLLKLARRSGTLQTIYAEVVHENDDFRWKRGLAEDVLDHAPFEGGPRGEVTHAYAVARFKEGGHAFIVLDRFELEKRRAMSDSYKADVKKAADKQHSPWIKWFEAMCRKSAIRALAPYLDLTVEAATAIASDDRSFVLSDDGAIDLAPLELEPVDEDPASQEQDGGRGGTDDAHARSVEPPPAAAQATGRVRVMSANQHQKIVKLSAAAVPDEELRIEVGHAICGQLGLPADRADLDHDGADRLIDALEKLVADTYRWVPESDNGPGRLIVADTGEPVTAGGRA